MTTWLASTRYLQKAAVDHLLGLNSTTMPTVYVALFNSDPGEAGAMASEVSGSGYGRQELTSKIDAFVLATGIATLATVVQFALPTAAWGTVSHIGLVDSNVAGAGNMLWYGQLTESFVMSSGSSPLSFKAGDLEVRIQLKAAGGITSAAAKAIGDHFLGKAAYTMPTACDMHLFTASPGLAGSFADEADYGGYAAVEITSKMAATVLSGTNEGISLNDAEIAFAAPASGSNVVGYTGISDGEVSPTLLFFGPLRRAITLASGSDAPTFPVGSAAVQMT